MWAAARRVGVRHFVTEDLQDGFELGGVSFVNPFKSTNNQLIDNILLG
jgi:predicted nucleic acid-binding protein